MLLKNVCKHKLFWEIGVYVHTSKGRCSRALVLLNPIHELQHTICSKLYVHPEKTRPTVSSYNQSIRALTKYKARAFHTGVRFSRSIWLHWVHIRAPILHRLACIHYSCSYRYAVEIKIRGQAFLLAFKFPASEAYFALRLPLIQFACKAAFCDTVEVRIGKLLLKSFLFPIGFKAKVIIIRKK